MTAPERDTSAEALGRIAQRAYWVTLLRGQEPTHAYDDEEAEYRRAWDESAVAVASQVVNPTAEDYDHAAEVMRLRAVERKLEIALTALDVIHAGNPPGTHAHDTAHAAMDRMSGLTVEPQPEPDVRPRADGQRGLDITCASCGENYGTNVTDLDEIECWECEARRCPHCQQWFGGRS